VLAIDIGGTKVAAALVGRDGVVGRRSRADTPATAEEEVVFAAVAEVVERAVGEQRHGSEPEQRSPVRDGRSPESTVASPLMLACGVGCGGPMTPGGESVSPLNIPAWRAFPLRSRLEELAQVRDLPVGVDNDAKALALGEGWVGAGRGERNFIAMVVSTGVGGGIVLDGSLLEGNAGNAGHIGHVVVEPDGRDCACGGRGCLEAEASGLSIEAVTGAPAADAPADVVERCGRLVGRAVASVANLLDLRLALVSGSVALGYGEPFLAAAQDEIDRRARIVFSRGCRIRFGGLGADGPLVGAGAVGFRAVGEPVLAGRP
jgi:glucokinase